jgi:hypothetical protein
MVLYGREEHRLRVFENRVLRRIFGPKRDEVTGGWRILHIEELQNLSSSPAVNDDLKMDKASLKFWKGKQRHRNIIKKIKIKILHLN